MIQASYEKEEIYKDKSLAVDVASAVGLFVLTGTLGLGLDANPATPSLIKGHIFDGLGVMGFAMFSRLALNIPNKPYKRRPLVEAGLGLLVVSAFETIQAFHPELGTFDVKDYLAYGVGAGLYTGVGYTRRGLNKLWR